MKYLSVLLSVVLTGTTLSPHVAQAQTAPGKLNLVIVEGDGAINNIRQRTAREPIVEVQDENHKPVAGAAVFFLLPSDSASGTFANGARSLTVVTDGHGRAVAHGLRINNRPGAMKIHVTASYQGNTATADVNQTNVATAATVAAGGISTKLLIILASGAAAITGGVIAATRGGSQQPAATTIGLGSNSVGAPR